MQTTFEVIGVDGISRVHTIELEREPTFTKLADIVNPYLQAEGKPEAFFEHIRVFHQGDYDSMFVDDMGALKKLPVNEAATLIYHANMLAHECPGADTSTWPKIHGVAVLFHRNVWF